MIYHFHPTICAYSANVRSTIIPFFTSYDLHYQVIEYPILQLRDYLQNTTLPESSPFEQKATSST
jgi:hypothetical protein